MITVFREGKKSKVVKSRLIGRQTCTWSITPSQVGVTKDHLIISRTAGCGGVRHLYISPLSPRYLFLTNYLAEHQFISNSNLHYVCCARIRSRQRTICCLFYEGRLGPASPAVFIILLRIAEGRLHANAFDLLAKLLLWHAWMHDLVSPTRSVNRR